MKANQADALAFNPPMTSALAPTTFSNSATQTTKSIRIQDNKSTQTDVNNEFIASVSSSICLGFFLYPLYRLKLKILHFICYSILARLLLYSHKKYLRR